MKGTTKFLMTGVLGFVLLLTACHNMQRQTFVNENDPNQTLELTYSPSLKLRAIRTFHGTELGSYRMTVSASKKLSGAYDLTGGELTLKSAEGEKLQSYKLMEDSSLRDPEGNLWRLATVKEIAGLKAINQP